MPSPVLVSAAVPLATPMLVPSSVAPDGSGSGSPHACPQTTTKSPQRFALRNAITASHRTRPAGLASPGAARSPQGEPVRRSVALAPLLCSRSVRGPGRALLAAVRRLVSYSALTVLVVVALVRRPSEGGRVVREQIARQIVFSAWDAIPLVVLIGALLSVSVVALSATLVPSFEATTMLVKVMTHVLVELAPLLAAVLVILRSCGAIAVELGYMSWRGEIEALETLGIDPVKFVVLPRFAGLVAGAFTMTLLFCVAAAGAGLLTGNVLGMAPSLGLLRANLGTYLHADDVFIAFVKSLLFGGTIAAVACHHGLSVRNDLTEVPRRGSQALVEALTWCTTVGVVITLIRL
jgi:phospholipid/cholesterol/gamma-HCH transport system permease protein